MRSCDCGDPVTHSVADRRDDHDDPVEGAFWPRQKNNSNKMTFFHSFSFFLSKAPPLATITIPRGDDT